MLGSTSLYCGGNFGGTGGGGEGGKEGGGRGVRSEEEEVNGTRGKGRGKTHAGEVLLVHQQTNNCRYHAPKSCKSVLVILLYIYND